MALQGSRFAGFVILSMMFRKNGGFAAEKFLYNFLTSFEVSCRYLFKNLCFGRRVFSSDTLFDELFSGCGIYLEAF